MMRRVPVLLLLAGALLLTPPPPSVSGFPSSNGDDAAALVAFKRSIFEDPFSVLADWGGADSYPCGWSGVTCSSPQGNVVSISLSNSSLKGFLAPELSKLTYLQELLLDHNSLLGTIPKQFGMLKNLVVLDLSANRLSGMIPSELGNLTIITKLNLGSNMLTGAIPSELGNLENLQELRLDRNQLQGPMPGNRSSSLCPSPQLSVGDFSYNLLAGKIPSCLKYLPRSSFQGNCFQDDYSILQRPIQVCSNPQGIGANPQTGKSPSGRHVADRSSSSNYMFQQPKWLIILEISTGGLLVVSLIIISAAVVLKRCGSKPTIRISSWGRTKGWTDDVEAKIDGELLKNLPRLRREELEIMCEDFSNIISSFPGTTLYKGTMKDGSEIIVLSLCASESHWTRPHELFFQNKVADLARLNHENVAKFLAYCKEDDPFSRMMVFEYASNGTLSDHLHGGEGSPLSWLRRMRIAIGIARGLRYLHTELNPPFSIRELNSNTIYVTDDFTPKLADFQCWKLLSAKDDQWDHLADVMGPTAIQDNIFAFGVILLEIISGRPVYSKDKGYLVDWARKFLDRPEEMGKLVDPELENVRPDDLAVVCSVVSRCVDEDPTKRPSMQIIASVLEEGIDLSVSAAIKESSLAWAEMALLL